MKKIFAFIFARGGSKGLSKKNILPLGGIPLVAHSIKVAKLVKDIDRIFVSTEDDEIKEVAKKFGAEVIDRPESLADDNTPEIEAWRHAITYLQEKGEAFDIFVSLPATSPLRDPLDVEACINALHGPTEVVITVTPAARSPYFNMVTRNENGKTEILSPSSGYIRRQDTPAVYDMTTVAYVTTPVFVKQNKALFDGEVSSVVVPKERAVDIDDYWDYKLAEVIYEGIRSDTEK